jgi:hypothetical protein
MEFNYVISTGPLRKPGLKAKGTITEIKEVKAVDVYKKAATNPEQLLFAIIAKVEGWKGRIGTIPKPTSKLISPKSKLALFKKRYKQFPKTGMKIDVTANDMGYWKLET